MMFCPHGIWPPYFLRPACRGAVDALRRAFDLTMRDPGFIADAAKIGLCRPMTGEQCRRWSPISPARPPMSLRGCARRSISRERLSRARVMTMDFNRCFDDPDIRSVTRGQPVHAPQSATRDASIAARRANAWR